MITIYGSPLSLFTRKARAALVEKGIGYRLETVLPGDSSPAYRRLHPLGKVPALRDGDVTLADSSVICAYVERAHPEPVLYPADPARYGRTLWLEEWADTAFASVTGPIVMERLIGPRFFGRAPDETALGKALDALPAAFDYLEEQLAGAFLDGESLTIADVAAGANLEHLRLVDVSPDPARWKKLAAYAARIAERPSFTALFAEDRSVL